MMTSIFSQMVDDRSEIEDDYDVLAGRWPSNYDEMIIVLSEPNGISDLLVYSLGLRDTKELTEMVTKIMSGETVDVKNTPLELTYNDLMNVDLRLIMPSDTYKYNGKYGVYEDMSNDDDYMNLLYDKALKLKIVGIVSAKEGVNSMALNPGVAYTSSLMDYIIKYANDTEIVKKQLNDMDVDVFSGKRFDSEKSDSGLNFENMISVDSEMLKSAFNMNIDNSYMDQNANKYMEQIKVSLANDIKDSIIDIRDDISNKFKQLAEGLFDSLDDGISYDDIGDKIKEYLDSDDAKKIIDDIRDRYGIDGDSAKSIFDNLLNDLFGNYTVAFYEENEIDNDDIENNLVKIYNDLKEKIINEYSESAIIDGVSEKMASLVIDGMVKTKFLDKLNNISNEMSQNLSTQFNVDQDKIAKAFKINLTEEELMRVISAMMNKTEASGKTNLISLGYQDKDDPTYIAVYFNSFDGKEHFLSFIDKYNDSVSKDKVINYSDTTGILMSSVKTIVNAVSYVLIAFVSISLVVSSIMIGIITYISVYERTKEIGILRSIGASKRNISSIFNAETFIIGLLSGMFGIGISYILIPIINAVLHHYTGNIPLRAALNVDNALVLVILSIILTLIGGLIPARAASKKDPVEALRSE